MLYIQAEEYEPLTSRIGTSKFIGDLELLYCVYVQVQPRCFQELTGRGESTLKMSLLG